ncbi:hypothetical protein F0P96_12970 [Hymenobacter busanensis]|uniref:Uncharacterized protein n=1 Tax=Hymenobacter busanensis TaxID=2607656 RepID=A0A7L4ZV22_9BACT|nr:hypothetical protein [Hymenobacter busanensis]KAA9332379.1 hypothetical protein F0P96_12970 [Hymenobacter busanensis]QHJ07284.1 hypothetical protein GUY19_08305 [Hymenobacter busanensis]
MANQFHQDIPAAVLQKVQAALDVVKTELGPYLVSLTPEQRKTMLRMADKTVAFVQKTTDYATTSPAFVPAFVDVAELKQDAAALTVLAPIHQQLEQLALDTDSTMMTAGSEAYGNALTIYNSIKFMAQNKQPGAQAAYDDLRQRFAGQGQRKAPAAKPATS